MVYKIDLQKQDESYVLVIGEILSKIELQVSIQLNNKQCITLDSSKLIFKFSQNQSIYHMHHYKNDNVFVYLYWANKQIFRYNKKVLQNIDKLIYKLTWPW